MSLIKLAKVNNSPNDENSLLCDQYYNWKFNMDKKQVGAKFFILFKDFELHLKCISSGALKLYLYYGFHAKNETGISWHSIDTIKDYFGVSEKSINNWNNELIERGLIQRLTKNHSRNKVTYLLPFSMNFIKPKNFEIFKNTSFSNVYGTLVKSFHFFQWRQDEENSTSFQTPYHSLILVYERKVINGDNQFTAFEISINDNFKSKCINIPSVNSDIYTFNSTIDLDMNIDINVQIQGIAVNSQHNLKKRKIIYELVKELLDPATNLDHYEKVQLINIEDLERND